MGFPTATAPGQLDAFKLARRLLPGPYTLILAASKEMPKQVGLSCPFLKGTAVPPCLDDAFVARFCFCAGDQLCHRPQQKPQHSGCKDAS